MTSTEGTTPAPESATPVCTELTWCKMTDSDEHAEYHSGNPIELHGVRRTPDGEPVDGYWAWATQDRGRSVMIGFETHDGLFTDIPAEHVAVVLAATQDDESRARLQALIDQVAAQ